MRGGALDGVGDARGGSGGAFGGGARGDDCGGARGGDGGGVRGSILEPGGDANSIHAWAAELRR